MAVGSFYQIPGIDVGPAVAGRFLDAYFNEIKAMNDLNDAALAEGGEDVADLNKMEIAARERLGKLHEALQEARSGDTRSYNDLMRTVIQEASEERRNIRTENANVAMKRMEIAEKYRSKAEKDDEAFKEQIRISADADARAAAFGKIAADSPLDADQLAETLGNQFDSLATGEGTGGVTDPRHIHLVAKVEQAMARSGPKGAAAARKFVEQRLPAAAAEGLSAGEYLIKHWAPETQESAQKEVEELWRKAGGAGARGDWQSDVRAAGGDPAQVFGTGSSSVSRGTSGGGSGGGSAAPRDGGSIAIEGMSPDAAKAMRAAAERGADPYDAMMAAIEAQAAYADDLAARRKSAAAKGPRSPYPRPNVYTVSPNRYVKFDPTAPPPPVGDAAFQAEMKAWRSEPRSLRVPEIEYGDRNERDWRSQNPDYKPPEPSWTTDVDALLSAEPEPMASKAPDWSADVDALLE